MLPLTLVPSPRVDLDVDLDIDLDVEMLALMLSIMLILNLTLRLTLMCCTLLLLIQKVSVSVGIIKKSSEVLATSNDLIQQSSYTPE